MMKTLFALTLLSLSLPVFAGVCRHDLSDGEFTGDMSEAWIKETLKSCLLKSRDLPKNNFIFEYQRAGVTYLNAVIQNGEIKAVFLPGN